MKNLLFLLPIILFFSCEKVIDVELNEANENLAIEAKFNTETKEINVLISKTTAYFNPEDIEFVSDAVVRVSNEKGNIQELELNGNGNYSTVVNFDLSDSLTLEVEHDLGIFSSTAEVVQTASLNSIEFIKGTGPLALPDGEYLIRVLIADDVEEENYYMFETVKNGMPLASFRGYDVIDDLLATNGLIDYIFVGNTHSVGDTVNLSLLSLNEAAYKYYGDLAQLQSEGLASASPANPVNNWSNNALGYFMVFAPTDYTIVIEE